MNENTTIKDPLDAALELVRSVQAETNQVRREIIGKLGGCLKELQINPANDKPMVMQGKMQVVSTLLSALDAVDKTATTEAKLQLGKKQEESVAASAAAMVGMIRQINVSTAIREGNTPKNVDDILTQKEQTLPAITAGELQV